MSDRSLLPDIKILDDARSLYEAQLQYDDDCPYANADKFVDKVRQVLNAGYIERIETYLLKSIRQVKDIDFLMEVPLDDAIFGGISFITQEAIKRTRDFWDDVKEEYPSPVHEAYYLYQSNITAHNRMSGKSTEKPDAQRQKSFTRKLRKAVKYLHTKNYLPDSINDLYLRRDALFVNETFHFSGLLYAILDYAFASFISDQCIDEKSWMEAVELTLCRHTDCSPIDFIQMNDTDMAEVLDHIWFQVVLYGCLIGAIRILGNKRTYDAIRNIYAGIDPYADKIKELELKALQDAAAVKEAADMIDHLEGKVKRLQDKLGKTPDYSRQISALNHEHSLALKEKDEEIQSLLARIERMETERIELETQMFQQDEEIKSDKPWLNEELPRDNVIFLGGHPNMLKKLKELYPEWTYIGKETEALHNLPKRCDCIFIWSGHISHGTWYHIDRAFEGREKYFFLQSTNIQRLEEEMKYELWKRREMDARRVD